MYVIIYKQFNCYRKYGSQWEYEVRTAGGPWPPPEQNPNGYYGFIIALACFGLGLLQIMFMFYSMKVRKIVTLRHARIQNEYQQTLDAARIKTNKFAIKDLNSVEDLNEYLTKDSSEC